MIIDHRTPVFDRPWTAPTLAIVLVVLFYGAALGYDLVWDDQVWLNEFHRYDVATLLRRNLTGHTLVSYYRPLVGVISTLQLALSERAAFLHGLNLAIHALNLLLIIALVKRVAAVSRPYLLPLGVAVLAIHPALVEPVVWVSGRFDLAYTTFLLLALLAAVAVRSRTLRATTVASCFFLALCCKESALVGLWVGPLLLTCIARHRGESGYHAASRRAIAHFAALAAGLVAYLIVRIAWLQIPLFDTSAFYLDGHPEYGRRGLLVLRTLGTYLQMTVLPLWNLEPLHLTSSAGLTTAAYGALGLAVVMLSLAAWRWPVLLPCTVWTAALLPAANFLPLRLDLVQDRYLYFPLFAASVAALSYPWPRRIDARHGRWLWTIAVLWLALAAVTNLSISRLWRDGVSLFSWAVAANPNSQLAIENLALAFYAAGDYQQAIATEQRIAEPARSFQGRVVLARATRATGDAAGAAAGFERALAGEMNDPVLQVSVTYELALLQRALGDRESSARLARAADALAARHQVSTRLRNYYQRKLGDEE